MKKTLLALAVLAAAGSVNAAEIVKTDEGTVNFYGQIRQNVLYNDQDGESHASINPSSSRAGIDASYKINESVKLVGKVETNIKSDWSTRQHYVGFASDSFGTIVVGQTMPLADDVYGAEYSYIYGEADTFLYDTTIANDYYWQKNSIRWDLTKDSFWVKAQYNLDEAKSAPEVAQLFAGTSIGNVNLHTGYVYMNDDRSSNTTSKSIEGTAEYATDVFTLGLTYSHIDREVDNADADSDALSVGAMVKVADKTTVYGGYQFADADSANRYGIDAGETATDRQVGYVGVEYKFASWGRTYAEYGFGKTKDEDAVNQVGVGARVYW